MLLPGRDTPNLLADFLVVGSEERGMRKPAAILGAVLLSLVVLAGSSAMGTAATPQGVDARAYLAQHGYLPIHGVDTLNRAKAWSAAAAAHLSTRVTADPTSLTKPTLGP